MKNKKDIFFLCQFFYPEYVSSATLPYDTAEYLKECGLEIGCLCGYPKEYSREKRVRPKEIYKGIFIKRLKYLQLPRKHFCGRFINYFSFFVCVLLNIFELRKYKIVFVYSNPPILPAIAIIGKKIFKNKVVFISYDVYPELAIQSGAMSEHGVMARVFRKMNKIVFQNTDMTVAVSEDMLEYLRKARRIQRDKIRAIPNWYDEETKKEFEATDILEDIPADAFVLAYLGNLGICQDEKILLDTMREMKDDSRVYFIVAGHGTKMEKIKKAVVQEDLKYVKIFGFLHGNDYLTVLDRSNAFVVTLIPGLKGLCAPSKVYAYFMAGKPVLAVMDSGMEVMTDIRENGAGVVISERRPEILSNGLAKLREDSQKCCLMGDKAREIFLKKYEKKVCLEQYKKLVFRLLEQDGGNAG